jgi:hypothetical protein
MNCKGSIVKILLIVILIISVALIGGVAYLYQIEISKNNKLQAQIDELTARERITEGKLEAHKKKVSELELQLQEADIRFISITEELGQEKSARQESLKELEKIKVDMDQQKISRQDIENKLTQAQNEGRKLKEQLKSIEQQKVELEVKVKNLEISANRVELGKVVVNSEVTGPSRGENSATGNKVNTPAPELLNVQKQEASPRAQPLEGNVTVVNKEYNFAVINLGQKDGIDTGDQFYVYRDGKVIGEVKVEKVHELMSAAGFKAELKDKIKENDLVVQKEK